MSKDYISCIMLQEILLISISIDFYNKMQIWSQFVFKYYCKNKSSSNNIHKL